MRLCDICSDLDLYSFSPPIADLVQGSANNCRACALLLTGIKSFVSVESISNVDFYTDFSLFARIWISGRRTPIFLEFSTEQGSPSIWPRIGPARDVSVDSSSEKCLHLAKSWLNKCLEKHMDCRIELGDPVLPSRVIDVGLSDSEMHLHLSDGERAQYAALSYCWGADSSQLRLEQHNLADLTRMMVFDAASETLHHAAHVTRSLGLRYLWIDSMCIIQGSGQDWEEQSARMNDVYLNATVTIAATATGAAAEGLYPDARDREKLQRSLKLPAPGLDGQESTIRVRLHLDDPAGLTVMSHSAKDPGTTAYSTRGWTLQEAKLSRRTLYFSKEEMYWVCSSHSRCECRIRPGFAPPKLFKKIDPASRREETSVADLYEEWPLLVMEFTRRNLSVESDRLAAMSGLAAQVEKQTGDTYLCGLWASSLRHNLTWFSDRGDTANLRMQAPYAPTWSWASISGHIGYLGQWSTQFGREYPGYGPCKIDVIGHAIRDYKVPLHIKASAIVSVTNNKYGPVSEASLEVSGRALPVRHDVATNSWKPSAFALRKYDPTVVKVFYDVSSEITEIQASGAVDDCFILLFVGVTVSPGIGSIVGQQGVCLLLRRVIESSSPVFKRCALVMRAGDDSAWFEDVPESTLVLI